MVRSWSVHGPFMVRLRESGVFGNISVEWVRRLQIGVRLGVRRWVRWDLWWIFGALLVGFGGFSGEF
jgi:hypothetical protein